MQNIKLIIAYDGTKYRGWQKTSTGPSIEQTLQNTLEQILQHPVALQAASRTDAGVHAKGQVVNFFTSHLHLDVDRFQISLNSLLPKDISVIDAKKALPNFHPTLDCKGKEYRYYICYGPTQLPHHRFYSWHYHYPLDLDLMQTAASILLGKYDFSTFCNTRKNSHYEHHIRELKKVELQQIDERRICIIVDGPQFLYKMVRNVVGTLAYIGNGKLSLQTLPALIESGDRTAAGPTAPAHGLFLDHVYY